MIPETKSQDSIAAASRDVLSRFKADQLPVDAAEAELLALFAATRPTQDSTGISGLRTHD